ncbi:MAG: hypothetical protein FJW20_21690 [Acidimicrobiia bacterium]|nr:hypothetical protein [Acidimicrobiia bacterium]
MSGWVRLITIDPIPYHQPREANVPGIFGTRRQHEFEIWHVKDQSPEVIYSVAVMQEIAAKASEASQDLPSGGTEICGVLYGTTDGEEIRITSFRALPCEHRDGPAFTLSAEDEAAWRNKLQTISLEKELSDLKPAGWYVSRTHSGIRLSDEDVRVWNRFFPEPWQVVLAVQPAVGKSTRAGFFFRPADGRPQTEASLKEFEAAPARERMHVVRFLDRTVEEPPAPEFEEPVPEPPPRELLDTPVAGGKPPRTLWYLAGALAVVVMGFGAWFWSTLGVLRAEPDAVAVQLIHRNGQLRATWDGSSPTMLRATSGTIEIQDGAVRVAMPLSMDLLRNGNWPIVATSSDVSVRLRVNMTEGPPVESAARFLNVGLAQARPSASIGGDAAHTELASLQSELAQVMATNQTLEQAAVDLQIRLNAERSAAARPAAAKQSTAAPVQAAPPPSAPPPTPNPFTERAAPRAQLPPAPALPQLEAPKPAPYSGPAAGQLIWTGLLPAGGTLTIEGRRPSSGSLNGALPGVAVRITAYPADLSSGGLQVYSGAAKHARGNVVEPRSAQNGWLETRYHYDVERARGVAVAEAPGEANNHQRIQIRSANRPVAALVIEWEVAQ